jgi:hypothetical protein
MNHKDEMNTLNAISEELSDDIKAAEQKISRLVERIQAKNAAEKKAEKRVAAKIAQISAERLEYLVSKQGKPQQQVAIEIGLDPTHLCKFLRGKREPSPFNKLLINQYFGEAVYPEDSKMRKLKFLIA